MHLFLIDLFAHVQTESIDGRINKFKEFKIQHMNILIYCRTMALCDFF